MLALGLIAVSLGLDNFAVSIAIGLSGVDRHLRFRVAGIFGLFEAGMPVIGLLLGRGLAHTLGGAASVIGGLLLIATGLHSARDALSRSDEADPADLARARFGRLLVVAVALSIDNLIVGFALGARHSALVLSVIVITVVSVALSLAGLELGQRLGARAGQAGEATERGELLGAVVLCAVGVAMLVGLL